MRTRILTAMLALSISLMMIGGAAAQEDTGSVTVIHGVPDLTVDVYLNGEPALTDFAPGTITDPLDLPAGDYDIEIRTAGADVSEDPAIAGSATVPAGANASVVAHLDADGQPTLSVFVNDVTEPAPGEARVVVRHVAAAPAVDIWAGEDPLFTNVSNPMEGSADVPAGDYSVSIVPAGGDTPVIDPATLTLGDGTISVVYAIGSLDDGSFELLIQAIQPEAVPHVVPATGGTGETNSMFMMAILAFATVALIGTGLIVRNRQRVEQS